MRPKVMALTLMLTVATPARAADTTWTQIGTYLQSACSMAQGGNQWFGGSSKLDWICNIASSYGFFTNNILNGDWEAFGKELIGRYSSDLVNYLGAQLGFDKMNTITASINDALAENYTNFRVLLMNAMTNTLRQQMQGQYKEDNRGLPVTTPGGMADWAVKASPYLTLAQTMGRTQNTAEMFTQLTKAAQAKKLAEQSNDAITKAVEPAMKSATSVIKYATEQDARGKVALSTREVAELHLNSFDQFMQQDASFRVAELQVLSEIAKQAVMTNTQLIGQLSDVQAALGAAENGLKSDVEQYAKANLDDASSAARQYTQLLNNYASLMDAQKVKAAQQQFMSGQ